MNIRISEYKRIIITAFILVNLLLYLIMQSQIGVDIFVIFVLSEAIFLLLSYEYRNRAKDLLMRKDVQISDYKKIIIAGFIILNLIIYFFVQTWINFENFHFFIVFLLLEAFFVLIAYEYLNREQNLEKGVPNLFINRNRINKNRIAGKIRNAKVIKKLDQNEVKKIATINFKDSIADCLICYRNIPNEHLITCPHCINFYHKKHLKTWLKKKPYCPNCREKINLSTII